MDFYTSSGKHIRLGKPAGAGGEATVYRVEGQPGRLAKIYSAGPRPGYTAKLAWMAAHPPESDPDAPGPRSLAWPLDLLYSGRGADRRLSGYLMPFVHGAVPVLEVFNPRLRTRILPEFDRRYLHRAARNLASAVAMLHAHDYVVGDLNESNILVTPSALVTLIDVDSFQVSETGPDGQARLHHCPVGKFEYTPPELQGLPLAQALRTPEHDAFGLGVLVFQLLMEGNHPFRARWLGKGEPPPLEQRIAAGSFPYVADSSAPLRAPESAPSLETLAPRLAELFRRCFADGHRSPALRPDAFEWTRALAEAERTLVQCRRGHWFSAHLPACPVCGTGAGPRPATVVYPVSARPPAQATAQATKAGAQSAPPAQPPGGASQPAGPYASPYTGAPASGGYAGAPARSTPPPGVRNPRPAAAPAGARPTRPSAAPQPAAAGAAPHSARSSTQARPASGTQRWQRQAWNFARRQVVIQLRRRYPWIPLEWGGPPPAGAAGSAASAGSAATGAPHSAAQSAPPTSNPQPQTASPASHTAPPTPNTQAYSVSQTPHSAAPAQSASTAHTPPYSPKPQPYYAPRYPNFFLRSLGHSALHGAGWGALAGAVPALVLAAAAGLLGESAGWLLLAGLGGAAGAAVSARIPGMRLAQVIDRRIGWRLFISGLGALIGAGLGALVSLPLFFLVVPVILGLGIGGWLGLTAGQRLHDLGLRVGWERIWRWGSLAAAGAWGAWLGRLLAGSEPGLQFGVWTAAQAAQFSGWVGSPAAAWALAGALAGGVGGALAGFAVDLPARLARLTD